MALADALNIDKIQAVIGGSLGGLQALEWGWLDAGRVASIVSLASSGRHSAWCLAWSEAQRIALQADPRYRDGRYPPGDPPQQGLAAARAIAMVGYRSPASLERRFGRTSNLDGKFAVNAWLQFHGGALVDRFDAHSYRLLLDAMDTHDLARGRGDYAQVLQTMKLPIMIGSISSDALYVPSDQYELAHGLPLARLVQIDSDQGHDGFLIDAEQFAPELRRFLDQT
jgi:homoserine O-acetyltransferase